ncbi:MAG: TolB family protein [Bacillota bacterium]
MGFFSRYKKIFISLGFILAVALLAYLLWTFFFKQPAAPIETLEPGGIMGGLTPSGDGSPNYSTSTGPGKLEPGSGRDNQNQGTTLPPDSNEASDVALGGITKTDLAVSDNVSSATMTENGQLRYYSETDGKFYRLSQDGPVALSDKVFHEVSDVVWSGNGGKAIIEYPDGSKISYDFDTGKQVTLPKHWEDFSFSPDATRISAKSLGADVENRYLVVANADGSRARSLSAIGNNDKDVYPVWSPNNQAAAMYTRGVDFNRQEVFFVGLNGENFKSTIVNGRGFQPLWSDSGDKLLYSVYSSDRGMNPSLWIVGAQGDEIGQNRTELGLNTWAEKCNFATNTDLYCAVPESLPEGAGLFPELATNTSDLLYKIDLKTGAKKLIAIPDSGATIANIMVSDTQDLLYYTDAQTGKLYEIRLK